MEAPKKAAVLVHFGWGDGLRAAAACSVAAYEIAAHFGAKSVAHVGGLTWRHLAATSVHGFDALLVLSGLFLAYPIFTARRRGTSANLELAPYLLGRLIRIAPAYLAVFAATLWLRSIAGSYGVVGIGEGLGNDGLRAVVAQLQALLLLPLLLRVYTIAPVSYAGIAALIVYLDLGTRFHNADLGAIPMLMLGVVAADVIVRNPLKTFALPIAAAAAGGAFALDPVLAKLPGPSITTALQIWNPLWALAIAAISVACARSLRLAELTHAKPIRAIARASYAIVLVASPAAALALHNRGIALPLRIAEAFLLCGVLAAVVWFALDRAFADAERRAALVAAILGRAKFGGWAMKRAAIASLLARFQPRVWTVTILKHVRPRAWAVQFVGAAGAYLAPLRRNKRIAEDAQDGIASELLPGAELALVAAAVGPAQKPAPLAVVKPAAAPKPYGPLPTMLPGMLATVVQRVGSQADLRAEVEMARHRIAESAASPYFTSERLVAASIEETAPSIYARVEPEELQPAAVAASLADEALPSDARGPLEGVLLPPEPQHRRVVTLAFSAPRASDSIVTVRVGPKVRKARAC